MKRREDDKAMLERHWMMYGFKLSSHSWKCQLNMRHIKNISDEAAEQQERGRKTDGKWSFTF